MQLDCDNKAECFYVQTTGMTNVSVHKDCVWLLEWIHPSSRLKQRTPECEGTLTDIAAIFSETRTEATLVHFHFKIGQEILT